MRAYLRLSIVALMVMALAGIAEAKGKKNKDTTPVDPGLKASVVKVDGKNLVVKTLAGEEKTIATEDTTVVVINGVTSKLADLKADQQVTITPSFGTPQKIEVGAVDPTPPEKKHKKNK